MNQETFNDIIDKCAISVTLSSHIILNKKLLQKLKPLNFEASPTEPRVLRSDSFPSPQTLLSLIETLRKSSKELSGASMLDKDSTGHSIPYNDSNQHWEVKRYEPTKRDLEFLIDLKKLKLCVSFKHALELKPDLIIVVGEPSDVLSGHSGFKAADLIPLDVGENINNVKTMKLKKSSYIFQLVTDDFTKEALTTGFVNLTYAVDVIKDILKSAVVTGSFLYPEKNKLSRNQSANVLSALCTFLCQFIKEYKKDHYLLASATITASEFSEAIPVVIKVIETELGILGVKTLYPNIPRESTLQTDQSHFLGATASIGKYKAGTPVDRSQDCGICYESYAIVTLSCCNKRVCTSCNRKFQSCPYCRIPFDTLTGTQPDGTMSVKLLRQSAAGYESVGSWEITYKFPRGIQKSQHPNPGQSYSSCERVAYLPDVSEGFEILQLLRLAFIRRLTFTIGKSLTRSKENVITWNDIHHKTNLNGGSYGYPDSKYLQSVKEELCVKGITLKNVNEAESQDLDYFISCIRKNKMFTAPKKATQF